MTRPTKVTLGIAIVIVTIFLASLLFGKRVDDALTMKVHPGMTMEQVEAILGRPNERQELRNKEELWGYYIREFGWSAWMNPVYIKFNSEGIVILKWCQ